MAQSGSTTVWSSWFIAYLDQNRSDCMKSPIRINTSKKIKRDWLRSCQLGYKYSSPSACRHLLSRKRTRPTKQHPVIKVYLSDSLLRFYRNHCSNVFVLSSLACCRVQQQTTKISVAKSQPLPSTTTTSKPQYLKIHEHFSKQPTCVTRSTCLLLLCLDLAIEELHRPLPREAVNSSTFRSSPPST